jgi:16S rRNA (cytidine1402-2'-O)-methyltransferase
MAGETYGRLYVVGTPIGNLEDLSSRAGAVLRDVDLIAAEDTRRTRGLLSSIGANKRLISYHEHNESGRAEELLEALRGGTSVALVSDAGTPLVSDPGWHLVRAARRQGIEVRCVPGPSAVTAALSICGLPTDRFVFEGFLPRRGGPRGARLERLRGEPRTLVFYESVHRLADTVEAMCGAFGAERPAALARELTKIHESVYSGSLGEIGARLGVDIPLKGEFVLVVSGARATAAEAEAERVFALLASELPAKKAVALTARITGMARNDVYRLTRLQPGPKP